MTTAELIETLRALDPHGCMEVAIADQYQLAAVSVRLEELNEDTWEWETQTGGYWLTSPPREVKRTVRPRRQIVVIE